MSGVTVPIPNAIRPGKEPKALGQAQASVIAPENKLLAKHGGSVHAFKNLTDHITSKLHILLANGQVQEGLNLASKAHGTFERVSINAAQQAANPPGNILSKIWNKRRLREIQQASATAADDMKTHKLMFEAERDNKRIEFYKSLVDRNNAKHK